MNPLGIFNLDIKKLSEVILHFCDVYLRLVKKTYVQCPSTNKRMRAIYLQRRFCWFGYLCLLLLITSFGLPKSHTLTLNYLLSLEPSDIIEAEGVSLSNQTERVNTASELTAALNKSGGLIFFRNSSNIEPLLKQHLQEFVGGRVIVIVSKRQELNKAMEMLWENLKYDENYYGEKNVSQGDKVSCWYFNNHLKDVRIQMFFSQSMSIVAIDQ